jgi:hypothetical protein
MLQNLNPVYQALERFDYWVWQAGVIQDILWPAVQWAPVEPGDAPRYADNRSPGRNGLDDDRAGANLHPATYDDVAQDYRVGANDHIVPDGRMPLGVLRRSSAQHGSLVHEYVVTYLSGLTDHYARAVINEESVPNASTRVDFHSGQKPI